MPPSKLTPHNFRFSSYGDSAIAARVGPRTPRAPSTARSPRHGPKLRQRDRVGDRLVDDLDWVYLEHYAAVLGIGGRLEDVRGG